MKILVTGYKGFIGSNLVKALDRHVVSLYEWGEPLPNIKGLDWVIHLGAISSTTEKNVEKVSMHNSGPAQRPQANIKACKSAEKRSKDTRKVADTVPKKQRA